MLPSNGVYKIPPPPEVIKQDSKEDLGFGTFTMVNTFAESPRVLNGLYVDVADPVWLTEKIPNACHLGLLLICGLFFS